MGGESALNDSLVTVVIPTYNRPIYLKRCIDSVLNQTYSNIEIIVVDDNDPETEARKETESVINDFTGINNIKYLKHEKNRNGSAARNTGWKASHGQYITFLDDDDEIDITKIEKQVLCLQNLDSTWGACYTGFQLLKENGKDQISSERRAGDCYIDALMRTMFMGSGSNLLLRKSVVDDVNGYDESFWRNQDIEFLARICEKYKLAYIDEILLTIHQEGERIKRTFDDIEKINQHYLKKFRERINNLDEKERERVIAVISLERFRQALYCRRFHEGIKILVDNKVSVRYILKYCKYLFFRFVTGKSYGFNGK